MRGASPIGILLYAILALAWLTGVIADFASGRWLWGIAGVAVFPIGIISGLVYWYQWISSA